MSQIAFPGLEAVPKPKSHFFFPLFLNEASDLQPLELVYHEDALGRAVPSENQ